MASSYLNDVLLSALHNFRTWCAQLYVTQINDYNSLQLQLAQSVTNTTAYHRTQFFYCLTEQYYNSTQGCQKLLQKDHTFNIDVDVIDGTGNAVDSGTAVCASVLRLNVTDWQQRPLQQHSNNIQIVMASRSLLEIFSLKFVKHCPRSKTKSNFFYKLKGKKFPIMIDDASCYLFCYASTQNLFILWSLKQTTWSSANNVQCVV